MAVKGPFEIVHYYTGLSTDTKPSACVGDRFYETNTKLWYICTGDANWSAMPTSTAVACTSSDPALNAAVTTAIVDAYETVIITLTGAGNAQTIQDPTITTAGKTFTVVNNDTSTHTIAVNGVTIPAGKAQTWLWDGTVWAEIDLGITSLPVPINQGGTGQITAAAAFNAIAASGGTVGGDITISGVLTFSVKEEIEAATDTLTTAQCKGSIINNYGQTDNVVLTLPAAAAGMHFTVILGTTVAKYFRIDPNASDSIYLDGTTAGDGKYVGVASAAVGNAITFAAFQTGAGAYDWYASTISGGWVSE